MKFVKTALVTGLMLYAHNSMAIRSNHEGTYFAPGSTKGVQCVIQSRDGDSLVIQIPTPWLRSLLPFSPNLLKVDKGCVISSEAASPEEYAKEILFRISTEAAATQGEG